MSKGERASKTSSLGPAMEHLIAKKFQYYLGQRSKGKGHQEALQTTSKGTAKSKGINSRYRYSNEVRRGSDVGKLASKVGRTEFYRTQKDAHFAFRALADIHDKSRQEVTAIHHLGSDNSGKKAAEIAGGKTKADIQVGFRSGAIGNYSLKHETADTGKSKTVKINNPGGEVLPKTINNLHAKVFKDKNGNDRRTGKPYQSPDLHNMYKNMKMDRTSLSNSVMNKPKNAEFLNSVFNDPKTPVTYTKGSSGAAKYNPKGGKTGSPVLNPSGMAYIRRIAEGDRKAIPANHPHAHPEVMQKAKEFYKEHESTIANPARAFTSKLHGALSEIMTGHDKWGSAPDAHENSKRHREAAHDAFRTLVGVERGSAPTHLVTVKRHNDENGKRTEPTVTVHNINRAIENHVKNVSSSGYEVNHTPGTSSIRIGDSVAVGFDRGSWNVQLHKKVLGDPDHIYSRNWQPK